MDHDPVYTVWPRRLLHVESMTCHTWSPGNVYGGFKEPLYNAISYTWGRWRQQAPAGQSGTAIAIKNVDWEVPSVDPAHFSTDELRHALRAMSEPHCIPNTDGERDYQAVDFIWIDVACIDQRSNSPESAAEIGRQATIFKGAQAVFIWLNTIDAVALFKIRDDLESLFRAPGEDESFRREPFSSLQKLVSDPWFTSLWTLQEAFLRTEDALFLSRDGKVIYSEGVPEPGTIDPFPDAIGRYPEPIRPGHDIINVVRQTPMTLGELIAGAQAFIRVRYSIDVYGDEDDISSEITYPSRWNLGEGTRSFVQALSSLLTEPGIWQLATKNPLATYTASHSRKTERTEDRIYGIQQIFHFRLGMSAPPPQSAMNSTRKQHFSLADLKIQFGEQLMRHYPVMSQVFVHTHQIEAGRAWLIDEDSKIPGIEEPAWCGDPTTKFPRAPFVWSQGEAPKSLCKLGVTWRDGQHWGSFEGQLCPLSVLWRRCCEYHESMPTFSKRRGQGNRPSFDIWPDCTEELWATSVYKTAGYVTVSNDEQEYFMRQLTLNSLEPLYVILLGSELQKGDGISKSMLGIVVCESSHEGVAYWKRLGACRWEYVSPWIGKREGISPQVRTFEGWSEDWDSRCGLLG